MLLRSEVKELGGVIPPPPAPSTSADGCAYIDVYEHCVEVDCAHRSRSVSVSKEEKEKQRYLVNMLVLTAY